MEEWYQDLKIERDTILKTTKLKIAQVKMPQDLKKEYALKKLKEKVFLEKSEIKYDESQEAEDIQN